MSYSIHNKLVQQSVNLNTIPEGTVIQHPDHQVHDQSHVHSNENEPTVNPTLGLWIRQVNDREIAELRIEHIQNIATRHLSADEALIEATENNDLRKVKEILTNGVPHNDPNGVPPILLSDEARGKALITAAKANQTSIVIVLFQHGKISTRDCSEAILEILKNGNSILANALLRNPTFENRTIYNGLVLIASKKGDLQIVQALLQNGSVSKETLEYAVIEASENGHLQIVQTLLQNGSISEEVRGVAVLLALRNEHQEIVKALGK